METFYRVDAKLHIVEAGGDWDQFAIDNSGDEFLADAVTGLTLDSFISGDQTRLWISAIIKRVYLAGETVEREYRCDSPNIKRRFRLTAQRDQEQSVLVTHQTITEEPMPTTVTLLNAPKGTQPRLRCSICNAIELDGEWVDPFTLGENVEYCVIHTVCESCRDMSFLNPASER